MSYRFSGCRRSGAVTLVMWPLRGAGTVVGQAPLSHTGLASEDEHAREFAGLRPESDDDDELIQLTARAVSSRPTSERMQAPPCRPPALPAASRRPTATSRRRRRMVGERTPVSSAHPCR